jgi:hypothetical protein
MNGDVREAMSAVGDVLGTLRWPSGASLHCDPH